MDVVFPIFKICAVTTVIFALGFWESGRRSSTEMSHFFVFLFLVFFGLTTIVTGLLYWIVL